MAITLLAFNHCGRMNDMSEATENARPLQFDIGGMHCAACSSRVERVISKLPGVAKATVNLATAKARVWPASGESRDLGREIMAKVAAIGFTATPARDEDSALQYQKAQEQAEAERKKRLARLWPMLAFSLPLLIVSMGHMLGMPLPAWLEPHQSPRAFILVQLLLTLPVVWLGRHFYVDGIAALLRRSPNMDSLVAVGTGAAFLYSFVNALLALSGHDPSGRAMDLYFESCAVLLTMIEFGQFLEFTARRKASDAIGALLSLTPETALKLDGPEDKVSEVPLAAIAAGDRLLVRPGSRVPVDGTLLEGNSAVDLSLLTGESLPVSVAPGDALIAGSVNGEGSMIMRATAVGQDTSLARIIRLVREAQGTKAPIARLADRVSFYFVPAVMLFATLAAAAWLLFSSQPYTVALTVFVAVLVMACPCAMGLATPMSIMVGTGRGAQMGVLVKNGAALEQTGRISLLCLDKTGTLTTGKPALTEIVPQEAGALSSRDILTLASALEGRSEHPLGLAIIMAARQQDCPSCQVGNVEVSPGLGIAGDVVFEDKTFHVAIGNEAFMESRLAIPTASLEKLESLADEGQTPLLMAINGPGEEARLAAILALADQLRPETPKVVEKLHRMGIKLAMLTGDNERTARAMAARAGIDQFHARLLPAQKADFIRKAQENGEVVGMVGDGLNDAPALALADVGMAVGSGVDVSAEAGDIVLMRGGMDAVLSALSLSRATMRNIRENLGWAFGYNILGLPIAAGLLHVFGGPMLSPMLAGLAMALSSFSVVTNALRLRWFKG